MTAGPAVPEGNPGKSSYLRHLPPVLWENEPDAPEFSLGRALLVFEKILTGVADGVTIPHGDHTHAPITDQIARLDRLFDAWQTPERFLPWLASWVALEFPTLQGQQLWDEYQRRKVTSEIARIYRLRGLKAGLSTYLDLYAVSRLRPRVALDDGSRVLTLTPGTARTTLVTAPVATAAATPVAALVTQGPVLAPDGTVWAEGLLRPTCVATAPDGSVFLGDSGTPDGVTPVLPSRVWRIGAAGHYELAGSPPKPVPVAAATLPLTRVVAVTVRPARDERPETLYALDRSGKLYAVEAPYTDRPAALVTSLATAGTPLWPVAMCVDGNGDLLVLDRGFGPPSSSVPKVITVKLSPVSSAATALHTVVEPLSLLVRSDGTLIVGDGGTQRPTGPEQFPGNLVRIDRGGATGWTETALLSSANPLVAPAAVTEDAEGLLYVLDTGLKPLLPPAGDPFVLKVAEPAAVLRVDPGAASPAATRITEPGGFVHPTGMAADGGRLIVCDPGQPDVPGQQTFWSRVRPYQFDVVIHFTESRLPDEGPARTKARRQAVGDIRTIVEQNKPAHTLSVFVK
ncbi:phage tail protein [Streptomyces sp. NBC_01142]|uniref:phage tail protein n=1 Tax=Streptomyces sp. NBC_01142 TaxID=2975865 RepID=UPI00224F0B71|nr:phage tail protein [Streptomyces sp. NBC_01142]MCX4821035.1 phage tail protein [Streptomyces sp. NBC_01142]